MTYDPLKTLIQTAEEECRAADRLMESMPTPTLLRRRDVTLQDLETRKTGPDLTPYDLARLSRGRYSDVTIRREIERGNITAVVDKRGRKTVHWITFEEARRYFLGRGLLHAA
jgi:hypothetical protein